MSLGNTGIKKALGKLLGKRLQAGALFHRRRNSHDAVILGRQAAERLPETGRKGLPAGGGLSRLPVKATDAMVGIRVFLRKGVALSFHRGHMQQHRMVNAACRLQRLAEIVQIMTIHRPHVVEAHVFEKGGAGKE